MRLQLLPEMVRPGVAPAELPGLALAGLMLPGLMLPGLTLAGRGIVVLAERLAFQRIETADRLQRLVDMAFADHAVDLLQRA